MRKIVLATRNQGKVNELARLLAGLPLQVTSLADLPDAPAIEETGSTFVENARLKALGIQTAVDDHTIVMADDSGLVVDALGGEPGVRSARYAGEDASDAQNNALLLERLRGVPHERRTAAFVCTIVLAAQGRIIWEGEGRCEGYIAEEPSQGGHGFGYDPLFVPLGYDRTFADMSPEEKDRISHRGRALRAAVEFLNDLTSQKSRDTLTPADV